MNIFLTGCPAIVTSASKFWMYVNDSRMDEQDKYK